MLESILLGWLFCYAGTTVGQFNWNNAFFKSRKWLHVLSHRFAIFATDSWRLLVNLWTDSACRKIKLCARRNSLATTYKTRRNLETSGCRFETHKWSERLRTFFMFQCRVVACFWTRICSLWFYWTSMSHPCALLLWLFFSGKYQIFL